METKDAEPPGLPEGALPLSEAPLHYQRAGAAWKQVLEAREPDYVWTVYYTPQVGRTS